IIKRISHREQAWIEHVRGGNAGYQVSAFVAYIGGINGEIVRELALNREIPLLRIGQMTVIKFSINSRGLSVVECGVEERRWLVLRILKSLVKQSRWSDTAVRAV